MAGGFDAHAELEQDGRPVGVGPHLLPGLEREPHGPVEGLGDGAGAFLAGVRGEHGHREADTGGHEGRVGAAQGGVHTGERGRVNLEGRVPKHGAPGGPGRGLQRGTLCRGGVGATGDDTGDLRERLVQGRGVLQERRVAAHPREGGPAVTDTPHGGPADRVHTDTDDRGAVAQTRVGAAGPEHGDTVDADGLGDRVIVHVRVPRLVLGRAGGPLPQVQVGGGVVPGGGADLHDLVERDDPDLHVAGAGVDPVAGEQVAVAEQVVLPLERGGVPEPGGRVAGVTHEPGHHVFHVGGGVLGVDVRADGDALTERVGGAHGLGAHEQRVGVREPADEVRVVQQGGVLGRVLVGGPQCGPSAVLTLQVPQGLLHPLERELHVGALGREGLRVHEHGRLPHVGDTGRVGARHPCPLSWGSSSRPATRRGRPRRGGSRGG